LASIIYNFPQNYNKPLNKKTLRGLYKSETVLKKETTHTTKVVLKSYDFFMNPGSNFELLDIETDMSMAWF